MAVGPQILPEDDNKDWYSSPSQLPRYVGRNLWNIASGPLAVELASKVSDAARRLKNRPYTREFGEPVYQRSAVIKTLNKWRTKVFSRTPSAKPGTKTGVWRSVVDEFRKMEPGRARNFYRWIYRSPEKIVSGVKTAYKSVKPVFSAVGKPIDALRKPVSDVVIKFGRAVDSLGSRISSSYTVGRTIDKLGHKAIGLATKGLGKGVSAVGRGMASKAGAAAGFAVAGASDGIRAGISYLVERARTSDTEMDYYDKYGPSFGDIALKSLKRLGWGLLRGIDGALFGIPSLIPGVGANINSNEYLETDASMFDGDAVVKLHSDIDELDRKGASAEEYVKLFKDYDERELAHLAKGEDVDGNKLAVLDHVPRKDKNGEIVKDGKGNIVYDQVWRDMSQDEAKAQVEMRRNISKSTAAERRMMLSDHGKDVDAVSIRSALGEIEADYAKKLDEIRNHYNDYENWSANAFSGKRERSRYVVDRGTMSDEEYRTAVGNARDDWASMALDNLERQNERRRKSIMTRDKYAEVIGKNRSDAMSAFLSIAGGTYDSVEAATSRFNEFWDSQSDAYRENITGQEMTRQLIEALRTRGQNSIQEG